MKKWQCFWIWVALSAAGFGQNVGDHHTAGFTNERSYLNTNMGDFNPPLKLSETIQLEGVSGADTIIAFENSLLIGEGGQSQKYHLYDRTTGEIRWTKSVPGGRDDFNYVPAFADDIVLLGSQGTSSVTAVRASTGAQLWQNTGTGDTEGRFPVMLNSQYGYYAGNNGLWAANATTGAVFWNFAVTTAKAPVTLKDTDVYILEKTGVLHALRDTSFTQFWSTSSSVRGNDSNIIATDKLVIVNDVTTGTVRAINRTNGVVVWAQPNSGATFAKTPGTALAYDRLFLFFRDNGSGISSVKALNPDTGAVLWEATDSTNGLEYSLVANNVVYFYNTTTNRIRAIDAFTGTLLWSILKPGVTALSAADSSLIVLLGDRVEIYRLANDIFFAHLADGGGQTTLMTLTNLADQAATVTLKFLTIAGGPLTLSLQGLGTTSEVPLVIPANGSRGIQTLGGTTAATRGWARVESDQLIRGVSIFQFSQGGMGSFEAGVADASPTGKAGLFVTRTGSFSTALAIANPLDETALVSLMLLNTTGTEVGSQTLSLAAGNQDARFVEELFGSSVVTDGFEGTVIIQSPIPVVITALRTQGGLQMSSYSVGQVVK